MNKTVRISLMQITGVSLVAMVALLLSFPGTASAHRLIGPDGKIHGCYRVKGKPKGALRVVRGARTHCRRGERKVAWVVAGAVGPTGATGTQGSDGSTGQTGTQVTVDSSVLKSIELLSGRVEELESTLEGVSNSDLTGMLATLEGLTNEELTEAVDAVPAVESLCEQSEVLTGQVNLLAGGIEGLGLNNALKTLGGLLEIPPLPKALEPFSC